MIATVINSMMKLGIIFVLGGGNQEQLSASFIF
jgi:hypothetical protein